MSDDLIARLRNPAMNMARACLHEEQARADMAEAADEIERLRAAAGPVTYGPSTSDIRRMLAVGSKLRQMSGLPGPGDA